MLDALPQAQSHRRWPMLASFMLCVALVVSGCASKQTVPVSSPSMAQQSAEKLLAKAQAALDGGEFGNAEQALQELATRSLEKPLRIDYLLLCADLELAMQRPDNSWSFLQTLADLMASAEYSQEIRYSLVKARYYEAVGQFVAAARERDFQSSMLSGEQARQNHERIWHDLMSASEEQMSKLDLKMLPPQFARWVELAQIGRNPRLTLDELLSKVEHWQKRYANHPAAQRLPGGLAQLRDAADNRPERVALLLPLSGPLAKTGIALRDGFMAAYYDSLNKGFPVPQVLVYDNTQLGDLNAAYAQAQFDGAQWLVGPVNKPQVQALQARPTLPLPTLALNYGERGGERPTNLYQFGLAAEDEAVQIADKAWADGKRHVLALLPNGEWGERVYAAFETRWLELGGTVAEKHFYPNRRDYNPDVRALLNVDDSLNRYKLIRRVTKDKVEFEPRRRQDGDWVFLVALPQQARQIKPTLAFNFAADLPVYATSHLYSGEMQPSKDRDLNGIQFCDVPWLLQQDSLATQVERAVPGGQGSYARLYAMGVDAFRLLPRLKQLELLPYSQVFGSTGALHLDSDRQIVRRTDCTVFEQGKPKQLSIAH